MVALFDLDEGFKELSYSFTLNFIISKKIKINTQSSAQKLSKEENINNFQAIIIQIAYFYF